MKELTKLCLDQLNTDLQVISTTDQQHLIGGKRVDDNGVTWWTEDECKSMMANETWTGGFVDDLGFVAEGASITDNGDIVIEDSSTGYGSLIAPGTLHNIFKLETLCKINPTDNTVYVAALESAIGANADNATYSGTATLKVDGEVIASHSLETSGAAYYTSEDSNLIGTCFFDIDEYRDSAESIEIEVQANQVIDEGYGAYTSSTTNTLVLK